MRILFFISLLLLGSFASAQMVEVYGGHQRAGVDIMWFKYFKDKKGQQSPWLFFSRNRASTNYSNQPAWGSTNAVSYNFRRGLGIVAVGAFGASGFTPKTGVQLYKQQGAFMFFGWLVADLKAKGNVDLFGLFRYQPKINEHWKAFSQAELFPVYNPGSGHWNLTQRFRLGAKYRAWAGGLMMDFNQTGKSSFITTNNIGGFIRYDF